MRLNAYCIIGCLMLCSIVVTAQNSMRRRPVPPFVTDTLMAHDPVMAYEEGTYYLFATGMGIMRATSTDRKTWTIHKEGVLKDIPAWTVATGRSAKVIKAYQKRIDVFFT